MSLLRRHTQSSARSRATRLHSAAITACAASAAMQACTWQDATGTHTLIAGLGVVSTQHAAPSPGAGAEPLARLERTREAGLILTPRGLTVGVADHATLTVARQAQVLARHTTLAAGDTLLTVSPIVVPPLTALPALGAAAPAHAPQEAPACSVHHHPSRPPCAPPSARTRQCWHWCCCP